MVKMTKKKTASISNEAQKHLVGILAEHFPEQNVQIGRALSYDIAMGGKHTIAMIGEQFKYQAEKERKAAIGYRAKHKAKRDLENQVGQLSTLPMDVLLKTASIVQRAIGDKKQTAVLFND